MVNTRIRSAALLIGLGFGALADGIVMHHVLQWHSMLSAALVQDSMEAMRISMAADGVFDAVAWLLGAAGVALLYSAFGQPGTLFATRVFVGYLLLGWGWFNLVEGIIAHHFLELHHVRDFPQHLPGYDWLYLAVGGVGLIAVGIMLTRAKSAKTINDRRAGYERRGTGHIVSE